MIIVKIYFEICRLESSPKQARVLNYTSFAHLHQTSMLTVQMSVYKTEKGHELTLSIKHTFEAF